MEHFLSITLFREVHDSTEREQRRDIKKVKECEWRQKFPAGSDVGKFSLESEYGRAWK